jgi:hypothetical protein
LKSSRHNMESLLLEIHGKITSLNVEEDFRQGLLEDTELAVECFKEKNILSVINCLVAIIGKLQTYVLFFHGNHSEIEKLLICIHNLQQNLIRLPICIIGPTGPMGATGATGPTAPGETTTIITSSCPVSCFATSKPAAAKSGPVDLRSHIVT